MPYGVLAQARHHGPICICTWIAVSARAFGCADCKVCHHQSAECVTPWQVTSLAGGCVRLSWPGDRQLSIPSTGTFLGCRLFDWESAPADLSSEDWAKASEMDEAPKKSCQHAPLQAAGCRPGPAEAQRGFEILRAEEAFPPLPCYLLDMWLSKLWSPFGSPKYWVPYHIRTQKGTATLTTTQMLLRRVRKLVRTPRTWRFFRSPSPCPSLRCAWHALRAIGASRGQATCYLGAPDGPKISPSGARIQWLHYGTWLNLQVP